MNWSRGLLRLWVVGSVIWVVVFGTLGRIDKTIHSYWRVERGVSVVQNLLSSTSSETVQIKSGAFKPRSVVEADLSKLRSARAQRRQDLLAKLGWTALPPLGFLVLGYLLYWAISGFRRRET